MKKILLALLVTSVTASINIFAAESKSASPKPQVIKLTVTDNGFEPGSIDVVAGSMVTLKVTRKTEATCATEIFVPSKKIKKDLPMNKEVTVELGKLDKGEIRFACGMDMISGIIHAK